MVQCGLNEGINVLNSATDEDNRAVAGTGTYRLPAAMIGQSVGC